MAALKRLVFIFVFLERALVGIQCFVYDNFDFRSFCIGVIVMLDLEHQFRFAFFETLEVEAPAAFIVDVENLAVGNIPAERMFVVVRACDFFVVLIEEFHMNMCAHAVGVDFEAKELGIFFAAVNAVERVPFSRIESPSFDFEMFVLLGGCGIAVAACREENGENGNSQELEFFHYKSFICCYVVANVYKHH